MAETPIEAVRARWQSAPAARALSLVLRWQVGLLLILAVGGALRFHGLDWDVAPGTEHPQQMHPDERFLSLVSNRLDWPDSIGGYFDTARSPLNPYNDPETHSYVYGTFPLFLGKAVSTIAGDDPAGIEDSYDTTIEWGRRLAAGVDTVTILVVFLIGSTLFGKRTGLAGAGLYALAVLPTQLAHFWTVDPFLTFFGALALLQGVALARERSTARSGLLYATLGVTLGLAVACKINGAFFFVVPVGVTALRWGLRDDRRMGFRWGGEIEGQLLPDGSIKRPEAPAMSWMNDVSFLFMAAALALITFRIAQPYAFTGPHFWEMGINQQWLDDIRRELDFQQGKADYPPFVQWAGRTPFLWPLRNMVLWGTGPALGIAAWVSFVAAGVFMFRRREMTFLLPLAFILPIFAFQGSRFVAFMRYFEPIYPALCVLAGWGLVTLWGFARSGRGLPGWSRRLPPRLRDPRIVPAAAFAAVVVVVAVTAWWAMAFQSVYSQDHPRIAASRWIIDTLPSGTRITGEFWDDTVPYPLPNPDEKKFPLVDLEPYQPDSPEKVRHMVYGFPPTQPGQDRGQGLNGADYVAISSNRIRDSVTRLEREYPATIRYYELLDSGELGFELVKTFKVHPTFLGLSIDDSSAEESFTVYDHPEVRLYKKTDRWDPERAMALLMAARPESAVNLLPRQGRTNGLQYTSDEAAVQQSKGTFTDVFDAGSVFSHAPWLWWLLWLELAAFAAAPWVTWLLRALPDRGYGLSKLLGPAAVVLATWMIVAWGFADFTRGLVWVVFALALLAGAALGYRRRASLIAEARDHWPAWVAAEGVFLAVFFVFLGLRAYNPDLWHHPNGGEKPMEIAYLTAVIRSANLPPYDPWFAGGTMNYYYMGWFFLAVPVRAMRIVPEVAFNLGVPTFASLAAVVAFSTVHNLVGFSRRAMGPVGGRLRRSGLIWPALLGAFLLVFISNLDPLHQTVERMQGVNEWGLWQDTPVVGGAVGIAGGVYQWVFHGADLPPFDWWRSSRVHFGSFDITEFPYFTLLFADLHPHLMGLPFFGLVIALMVAYVATMRDGLRLRGWLLAGLMGFALGLERTVHTWDFPTAVLITLAGLAIGYAVGPGRWQRRWWDGAGHAALAGAILTIGFSPYTAHFEVFNSRLQRAPETTEPQQYVAQFGIFAVVALAFLVLRYYEELDIRDGRPGKNLLLASVGGRWELGAYAVFVAGLTAFTSRFGVTVIALSAVAVVMLLNLVWLEWRRRDLNIGRLLATLMLALALSIGAGVDVVTVKDDIERMNTVFKFGLQAWQLFALGSAFAAWYVAQALARRSPARGETTPRRLRGPHGRAALRWSAAAVGAFLLLSGSIYLWSGTRARQDRRFAELSPTLDGLAYLDSNPVFAEDMGDADPGNDARIRLADDRPIIEWLRQNVQGSPVIVEAVGPLYHWTGRISENTGLPAVIGWDWHQVQQRWDYSPLVQKRRSETDVFWKTRDANVARQYLRKYNVSYVVVGTEEVAQARDGLKKFENMQELQEVWRSGDYAIYRVDRATLAATTASLAALSIGEETP